MGLLSFIFSSSTPTLNAGESLAYLVKNSAGVLVLLTDSADRADTYLEQNPDANLRVVQVAVRPLSKDFQRQIVYRELV